MVNPNVVFCIVYVEDSERIFKPIIFHPFDPNVTLNLGEVVDWVKEENIFQIHFIMVIVIPIWAIFGVLVTFRS